MSDSVAKTILRREGRCYEVSTIIRRSSVVGDRGKYGETMAWIMDENNGSAQCVGQWATATDDRACALEMHFKAVRQIVRKGEQDYAEE